jgi:hypothetical protein
MKVSYNLPNFHLINTSIKDIYPLLIFVQYKYKRYLSFINIYAMNIYLLLMLSWWNDFSALSFKQKYKIQGTNTASTIPFSFTSIYFIPKQEQTILFLKFYVFCIFIILSLYRNTNLSFSE